MHTARWVARYRKVFFVSLIAWAAVQAYVFLGSPFLGVSGIAAWVGRIHLAAAAFALMSAAAIVVSLALRAYDRLDERDRVPD